MNQDKTNLPMPECLQPGTPKRIGNALINRHALAKETTRRMYIIVDTDVDLSVQNVLDTILPGQCAVAVINPRETWHLAEDTEEIAEASEDLSVFLLSTQRYRNAAVHVYRLLTKYDDEHRTFLQSVRAPYFVPDRYTTVREWLNDNLDILLAVATYHK